MFLCQLTLFPVKRSLHNLNKPILIKYHLPARPRASPTKLERAGTLFAIIQVFSHREEVRKNTYEILISMLLTIAFLFCFTTPGYAMDVTLVWNANPGNDIAGYELYYKTGSPGPPYNGTGALDGDSPIDVGNVTEFTIHGLTDCEVYRFVVTAYDDQGNESDYSNEVMLDDCIPGPNIREVIPHHNAGITDSSRIPNDTSFCVRFDDYEGINITDTSSIIFTIDDGVNEIYTRDLSDDTVVRMIKLTEDDDTQVTRLWAVYDRSREGELGNYPYDTNVNIRVDAKERWQEWMPQASYDFNIESSAEHNAAQDNLPDVSEVALDDSDLEDPDYFYDAGTQVESGELEGAKIVYDSSEPVKPTFGPMDEVTQFDINGVGAPMNLQPPTVFNTPVKIFIPCPGYTDVSGLDVFLYKGTSYVLALKGEEVQPEGDGWMVPGSRVNHNNGDPSTIEIKIYHFSAVQAGSTSGSPSPPPSSPDPLPDGSPGTSTITAGDGGCFISTVAYRSLPKEHAGIPR